jgi:hypothetical protein
MKPKRPRQFSAGCPVSLEQIQNEFIEFLYTPRPEEEQKNHIRSYFLDPKHPDPYNGLKVYRGNLVFGLIGAMKETYVFTRVLLGENNFNFFCRDFLYQNPSHDSDLIQYGEGFGEFLAARAEIAHLAFIPEVTRLEWALERVFYAKPEDSFMGELPENWRESKPRFKNSVHLVQSQYKIHEAWLNFTEKGEAGFEGKLFKKEPESLVVWSDKGSPRATPVNETLAIWMKETIAGKTASSIVQSMGLSEENVLEAYRFAARQGWIAR